MSYSNGALGWAGSHWEWHMLRDGRTGAFRGWFWSDESTATRINRCRGIGAENYCGRLSLISPSSSNWSWRSISEKVPDPLNPFRSTSRHVAWIWTSSSTGRLIESLMSPISSEFAWVYHSDGSRVA